MRITGRGASPLGPPSPLRLRRGGRRWPWLLLLVPLAVWAVPQLTRDRSPDAALALTPTTAPTAPTLVGFAAPVGERTTGPRCWMVVVDESTSMASADSAGTRADAVRATADFLGAYGIDGDRIGATWFADGAEVLAPKVPAEASTSPTGSAYLGSGTRMSTAFTSTLEAMNASCGTAAKVIVLVSDGAASGVDEFAMTRAAVVSSPDVALHVIAMNDNDAFEASRAFWEDPELGVDSIQTIESFGRDEVAAAVADILSTETGQQVAAT